MNTKAIAVIAAFTALTTTLNFIKIPAPYLPTFSYQMGDIALVIAFLLFGPKIGITIAFSNMLVSLILPTGPGGFVGPPYYFIAVTTMLFGLYVSEKFITKKMLTPSNNKKATKPVIVYTALAILTRTLIMLPFDYIIYGLLVSIVSGLSISTSYAIVLSVMPLIILYNITVPLHVVPISYYISKRIPKNRVPM
jgi:riboflavin transporter FmnP